MIDACADGAWDTPLSGLHRAGRSTRLRPKVFQGLHDFLTHCDRVVSKYDLCEQVWPDQRSSDAALGSVRKAGRQAVGDSGRTQRIIQTLRGHGYRLMAAVEVHSASNPAGEGERTLFAIRSTGKVVALTS